jgi:regulator of cell morphogenesis and NO signaling
MTKTVEPTLGDLVTTNPAAARVFETFGLDYCCHGRRTLRDACAAAGIAPAVVEAKIAEAGAGGDTEWAALEPAALADHIVATHHVYLHEELPLLEALAAKVLAAHGQRHPELDHVHRLVAAVRADLDPHMAKEERVLFPAIHALAAGQRDFPFGTVANPIRMMGIEHEQVGELLAELRRVTSGYAVPADGCASYRSLHERLEALELDTHLHIHKENHTLFPAAQALYDARAGRPSG